MGALDRLPTLAQVQAARAGKPNWKRPTRLDDATAADKDDAKKLRQWAAAVKARDGGLCRVCGVQTIGTCELDERRGENHHIVSRTNPVTRHDRRNGLHVCLRCHRRFKAHKLFVVGTAAQLYRTGRGVSAKWYLNADLPLTFSEKHP